MWKCENEEDHNAIEPLELALFGGREKKFFHLKNPISLSSERIIIIFYIIFHSPHFHIYHILFHFHISYPCNAAAPLTISVSSVVIAAWRARLYDIFNDFSSSLAFSLALSIAVMRAPCSDAFASSTALNN
jgi:hypothetical protein